MPLDDDDKKAIAEMIEKARPRGPPRGGAQGALRAEARRLSGALAAVLDVPVHRDLWAGAPAAGVARRG